MADSFVEEGDRGQREEGGGEEMTDNFLEKGDRERMVCLWSQGSRQQVGSAREGGSSWV